jgi:hypothetical protein
MPKKCFGTHTLANIVEDNAGRELNAKLAAWPNWAVGSGNTKEQAHADAQRKIGREARAYCRRLRGCEEVLPNSRCKYLEHNTRTILEKEGEDGWLVIVSATKVKCACTD